jgi:hypothetical protein
MEHAYEMGSMRNMVYMNFTDLGRLAFFTVGFLLFTRWYRCKGSVKAGDSSWLDMLDGRRSSSKHISFAVRRTAYYMLATLLLEEFSTRYGGGPGWRG